MTLDNKSSIELACECFTTPFIDCLHYVFYCCGKNFRCDICNTRFKDRHHLVDHLKESHSEIFNFRNTINLKTSKPTDLNNGSVHIRIRNSDLDPDII